MSKKILLADDHNVVRQGVSLILKEHFNDVSIYHTDSFKNVITNLEENSFDLLILDINLPEGNSVTMIEKARAVQKELKILIFSAFDEEQYALRYLHAGANGYLNKLSSEDDILEAVKTVLSGSKYVSDKVKDKIYENVINNSPVNPLDTLSNRELEIAGLLAEGEGNLEIANRLNIQMSTVSTYKNRIFEKLEVTNLISMVEKYKLYSEGV